MEPDNIDKVYLDITTREVTLGGGEVSICLLPPENTNENVGNLLTEINESNYRIL